MNSKQESEQIARIFALGLIIAREAASLRALEEVFGPDEERDKKLFLRILRASKAIWPQLPAMMIDVLQQELALAEPEADEQETQKEAEELISTLESLFNLRPSTN